MTLAERIRAARAMWQPILIQTRLALLCVMPGAAYEARADGLRVTVTLLSTGECAVYTLTRDEEGHLRLPGFAGYWLDLSTAVRDLALLAAFEGQPADLSHLAPELEVAA